MPLYKYKCEFCGEKYRRILPERVIFTDCPNCEYDGRIKEVPSHISTRYKGSGFYETDYNGGQDERS